LELFLRNIYKRIGTTGVIIDAGAHIGLDSISFAKAFPQHLILALEPISTIYAQLVENCSTFSNIMTYRIALSDKTGQANMNVSSGTSDASSSLLDPLSHLSDHPNVIFDTTEEINTISLDEFVKKKKIDGIALLWLDLQGMEPIVLRGSKHALSITRLIHTEVSFKETYKGVEVFSDLNDFLVSSNFRLLKLNHDFEDMGNALYENISLIEY
jgi:FkbM family methyltransferase